MTFALVEPGSGDATAEAEHDTPVGTLRLTAAECGLVRCVFAGEEEPGGGAGGSDGAAVGRAGPDGRCRQWLDLARRELDAYFAGRLRTFTVPVDLRHASAFHRTVLAGLAQVGYGTTTSYGRLAAALALPAEGARSVGRAMALNPVLVVVPCHRVVGASGSLVGYAGGLAVKRRLLDLEAAPDRDQLELAF